MLYHNLWWEASGTITSKKMLKPFIYKLYWKLFFVVDIETPYASMLRLSGKITQLYISVLYKDLDFDTLKTILYKRLQCFKQKSTVYKSG